MEKGITKNQIISELTRSEHGDLKKYLNVGKPAASQESEFFAHLIAWDALKGQIRDAHVALPVISLAVDFPKDYLENSLAHIAQLRPRDFLRAYRFGLDLKLKSNRRKVMNTLTADYLHYLESSTKAWDRTAVQHRRTLKELYALAHVKPSARAQRVLFLNNYPPNSVFEKIARLKDMSAQEAAGTIMECRIPFLVAIGALGAKAKDTDLALALIERMSPTELVTNTKMLEKLGVKTIPALRAAFEDGLKRAAKSKKTTLKTTRAAEQITDAGLKAQLNSLQEKQLQNLGGVEGNWLVLGDKSGSMEGAIETARQVASILSKMVKGTISLVFFDTMPRFIDVTGKTYEQIKVATNGVTANGGTSIGCGLLSVRERNIDIDGIAVVSDAAENSTPYFVDQYKSLVRESGREVPVYLYRVGSTDSYWADKDLAKSMKVEGLDIQEFDLSNGVDYFSLPNLVLTMRTQRYKLVDEIMETKLLTLSEVLKCQEENTLLVPGTGSQD